jgi:dihydroneopterin aldolase
LSNTVNYSEVYQVVEEIIGGEPVNLIETLAERIAETLLLHFSLVRKTRVRVAKPGVAIAGSVLREAAVSVFRSRTSPNQTPELG